MITNSQFGFNGMNDEYDEFCLSRRCKQRKKERHKARMSRKESRTDQRRAETELMRAETSILKRSANMPTVPANVTPTPTIIQQAPAQPAAPKPQVMQVGIGNNKLMLLLGVLAVGGFLYTKMKSGKNSMDIVNPSPTS